MYVYPLPTVQLKCDELIINVGAIGVDLGQSSTSNTIDIGKIRIIYIHIYTTNREIGVLRLITYKSVIGFVINQLHCACYT